MVFGQNSCDFLSRVRTLEPIDLLLELLHGTLSELGAGFSLKHINYLPTDL